MFFENLKFGLAPMAGYTDSAFRLLCMKYGADFSITELISSESIVRGNEQGFNIAFVSEEERKLGRVGVQLFGSNPKSMADAAVKLEKNADWIDLNFGCPAPKVTRNLGGAALLARPERIKEIVEAVVGAVGASGGKSKKPITAKMRLGTANSDKAVEIAKLIEQAGTSALFVHARTLKQGYAGEPDWSKIAEIKKELSIPVFGNGNVCNYSDAERMFNETKCNGILVGRAALGNPFIFKMLKEGKDFEVDWNMRKSAFLEYLQLREQLKLRESVGDLKAQAITFVQGIQGASELRLKISQAKEKEEIISCF
ncbi:MAG: tRNA-dihydrouridine synthase family protein [Candidatus Micrarchaeia archaeon]|jgi:nifR3 family TIM-barrel protein